MSELFSEGFSNFRDEMNNMGYVQGVANMMNESMDEMHMMHPYQNLINTVQDCEITCEHMMHMIKHRHDVNMRIRQLNLLHDCADICTLTAKYLGRMSSFSRIIANTCAFICKVCGDECAKFPDVHSQHCAQICQHCARECAAFAKSKMQE